MRQRASNWFGLPNAASRTARRRLMRGTQGVDCGEPASAGCCAVRLVDDEQIPAHRFQRTEHLRPLHEIDRRDVDTGNGPGIHVRGSSR